MLLTACFPRGSSTAEQAKQNRGGTSPRRERIRRSGNRAASFAARFFAGLQDAQLGASREDVVNLRR